MGGGGGGKQTIIVYSTSISFAVADVAGVVGGGEMINKTE